MDGDMACTCQTKALFGSLFQIFTSLWGKEYFEMSSLHCSLLIIKSRPSSSAGIPKPETFVTYCQAGVAARIYITPEYVNENQPGCRTPISDWLGVRDVMFGRRGRRNLCC